MLNVHKLKQEICAIGDRLYKKGFAAANDGNITYRISENQVICTPTMITKGFMKPDDLCLVDMEGNQLDGRRKRTSEVKLHLAIMKERPDIKSVVHCHPPHATAFGVAREPVPQCVLPEVEIFIGDVPITKYAIPGGQEFADTILPFVHKANVIILGNHGTVSFDSTVEKAYWWTEILDAYCRILMLAKGLGRISYFTEPEAEALMNLKEKWGYNDPRGEMKNCELCANDVFRQSWKETGVQPKAFEPPRFHGGNSANGSNGSASAGGASATPDQEALIQTITERVMAALSAK
ncbi:MAG TPA: class II aldolase/adducin family protein [Thermoguttaceae bacterium]|nr:class II aldolase/adducin family protein [Thermoguttaceae bacterium]